MSDPKHSLGLQLLSRRVNNSRPCIKRRSQHPIIPTSYHRTLNHSVNLSSNVQFATPDRRDHQNLKTSQPLNRCVMDGSEPDQIQSKIKPQTVSIPLGKKPCTLPTPLVPRKNRIEFGPTNTRRNLVLFVNSGRVDHSSGC